MVKFTIKLVILSYAIYVPVNNVHLHRTLQNIANNVITELRKKKLMVHKLTHKSR